MSNYFVSLTRNAAPKNGSTIHDPSTKLKVKVVDLLKSKFVPQKGEVSFFVTAGNETLAFETKGYKHHRQLLILHMVAWYCMYLGLMEAQIHSSLPSIYR